MGPSSTASNGQAAPGLFLLAWGLFASVAGWGLVTNYRGFADKFTRTAHASSAWMQRVPPWKWMRRDADPDELARRAKLNRLIGIPFAILGPIVTVLGVVQILRGHFALPRGPVLPLPISVVFIAATVFVVVQYWRRNGLYRLAARQGGWTRGAAIVASAGAVAFGILLTLGQMTLAIAGWLVGGLASVALLLSHKSSPPAQPVRLAQPQDSAGPPAPADKDDDGDAFRWL